MTFDLSSLGWDDAFGTTYGPFAGPDREPARVTRVDPGVCTALGARGVLRASLGGCLLATSAADPARLPCPGDWIVVQHWPDERTTVERVLPRRTTIMLAEGALGAAPRVLAANVDTAAVVVSTLTPDHGDIARLLGLARAAGAPVILILTTPDQTRGPTDRARRLRAVARDVDVDMVPVCSGADLELIRPYAAAGRTLALLGATGSERSRLINALVGAEALSHGGCVDIGLRHVHRGHVLIPVPGGGAIVDTPGGSPGRGSRRRTAGLAEYHVRPDVNPSRGQKAGPTVDRVDRP